MSTRAGQVLSLLRRQDGCGAGGGVSERRASVHLRGGHHCREASNVGYRLSAHSGGLLADFHDLYPQRFHNVTNGVTPRRWMAVCNPDLTRLLTEAIGDNWLRDTEQELPRLEPFADDRAFRDSWHRVQRANKIALAAEIEASGTGNMKFSMNGALTIGTLDGANIEIRDAVGAQHFFLFGQTAEQVRATKAAGYAPRAIYERNPRVRQVFDLIASGHFSGGDRDLFRPLVDSLLARDEYLLLADYDSYLECQDRVDLAFDDRDAWARASILTVARMGRFSSDRAVRDYCRNIWHVGPAGGEFPTGPH